MVIWQFQQEWPIYRNGEESFYKILSPVVDPDPVNLSGGQSHENTPGQFHIGEHLMAKNNLQNSLKLLVLMYR